MQKEAQSRFLEVTDSGPLARHLASALPGIIAELKKDGFNGLDGLPGAIQIRIDGILRSIRASNSALKPDLARLTASDELQLRKTFSEEVSRALRKTSEKNGGEEKENHAAEWHESYFPDEALAKKFIMAMRAEAERLGKEPKRLALEKFVANEKVEVSGRRLHIGDYFRHWQAKASASAKGAFPISRVSVGDVYDRLESLERGTAVSGDKERELEFLQSREVASSFLTHFAGRPVDDFDLSSNEGRQAIVIALGRGISGKTGNGRWKQEDFEVPGKSQRIRIKTFLAAWAAEKLGINDFFDFLCRTHFGFSYFKAQRKLNSDRSNEQAKKRRPRHSPEKSWTKKELRDPSMIRGAIAKILGIENPNWKDPLLHRRLLTMRMSWLEPKRLAFPGRERISPYDMLKARGKTPSEEWVRILEDVIGIPDAEAQRKILMPYIPHRLPQKQKKS